MASFVSNVPEAVGTQAVEAREALRQAAIEVYLARTQVGQGAGSDFKRSC